MRTTSRKISSTRSWPGSWSSQPPTGTTSQTRPRYPSRPGSGGSGVSRGPRLSQGMVACRGALACGLLSCRGALACPGGLSALLVLSSGSVWTCGSLRSAVPEILRLILKAGLAVFPMCRGHPLSAYGRFSKASPRVPSFVRELCHGPPRPAGEAPCSLWRCQKGQHRAVGDGSAQSP